MTIFNGNGWELKEIPAPPPPPEPTQAELDAQHNAGIKAQIAELEAKQPRTVREYLLGDAAALSRLQDLEIQIAALRAQLK